MNAAIDDGDLHNGMVCCAICASVARCVIRITVRPSRDPHQCFGDRAFVSLVERRGRLIQHQHSGIRQQRARHARCRCRSPAESVCPRSADHRVVAVRQAQECDRESPRRARRLRSPPRVASGRAYARFSRTLAWNRYGAWSSSTIARRRSRKRKIAQVVPVEANRSRIRDRKIAPARSAIVDFPAPLGPRITQDRPAGDAEGQIARAPASSPCRNETRSNSISPRTTSSGSPCRSLHDLRSRVEQLEHARQRHTARDQIRIQAHQILNRREQPHMIRHQRHQRAGRRARHRSPACRRTERSPPWRPSRTYPESRPPETTSTALRIRASRKLWLRPRNRSTSRSSACVVTTSRIPSRVSIRKAADVGTALAHRADPIRQTASDNAAAPTR